MDPSDERLTSEKQNLRRQMSAAREALAPQSRREATRAACDRLAVLGEVETLWSLPDRGPPVVAGYMAVPAKAELDPEPFLAWVRAKGGRVVLPRVDRNASPRLRFHEVQTEELRFGAFGLLEPDAGSPEVPLAEIDLIVVPGLAFDEGGRRVGWGGGYYDELARCLSPASSRPCLAGLAYDFQIVDRCPAGAADRGVDVVVTDRRVLRHPLEVR